MDANTISLTVGLIGTFLSLIGLVAAYYFYRKSIRTKEPLWAIRSYNVIRDYSSALNQLKILYQDEEVKDLSISKVLIWNGGTETIDSEDIKTHNPIRILGSERVRLLDAKVIASNNISSQFSVSFSPDHKNILLDFDYLDHGQGAVIQVIHTGTSSSEITVTGDIKGAKRIFNPGYYPIRWGKRFEPKTRRKLIGISVLFASLIFTLLVVGSVYALPQIRDKVSAATFIAILFIVLAIFVDILSVRLLLSLWQPYSPSGLEVFEEELTS